MPEFYSPRFYCLFPIMIFLLSACATTADQSAEKNDDSRSEKPSAVLARMGSVSLTSAEFKDLLVDLTPEDKRRLSESPPIAEKLLHDEIIRIYLLQESEKSGWSGRPEVVRKARRSADQTVVGSFIKSRVKLSTSFPDDALVRKTYSQNRESLRQGDQIRLSQIFVRDLTEAGQDQIKRIYILLAEKPENFAKLAEQYSQHTASAGEGGDMGWQALNRLPPVVVEVLNRMKAGDISSPIQTPEGLHIIQLTDRKPGGTMTLEQARPYIVEQLRIEETRKKEKQYLQGVLKRNPVKVDSGNLDTFLKAQ